MKRNLFFSVLLIAILALGFVACDSNGDNGGGGDTWYPVTPENIMLLDGTWTGTGRFTERTTEADYPLVNITAAIDITRAITIDGQPQHLAGTNTWAFSGGNINAMWPMIRDMLDGPGVTINDANRSVTETFSMPVPTSLLMNLEVNQDRTRIRTPLHHLGAPIPNPVGLFIFTRE